MRASSSSHNSPPPNLWITATTSLRSVLAPYSPEVMFVPNREHAALVLTQRHDFRFKLTLPDHGQTRSLPSRRNCQTVCIPKDSNSGNDCRCVTWSRRSPWDSATADWRRCLFVTVRLPSMTFACRRRQTAIRPHYGKQDRPASLGVISSGKKQGFVSWYINDRMLQCWIPMGHIMGNFLFLVWLSQRQHSRCGDCVSPF
jgi:hypothetical protein